MKLGAQLYSIRKLLQTPTDLRKSFEEIAAIGYENVQLSAAGPIDPHELKSIVDDTGMSIVCTHVSFQDLIEKTDTLIEEHKIFGSPVIGLGYMPKEFQESEEGLNAFFEAILPAARRVQNAGLTFAYHNHAFEFHKTADGSRTLFDVMLERCPDWSFILDTYWVEYAGYSAIDYLKRVGGHRLSNVHFKDMARDDSRAICPCGEGRLDFRAIAQVCNELGVKNALVEQDNANATPDPLGEMKKSFLHLRPIIH